MLGKLEVENIKKDLERDLLLINAELTEAKEKGKSEQLQYVLYRDIKETKGKINILNKILER